MSDQTRTMTLYMCGVDWQHELGKSTGGIFLYASEEDLCRHRKCVARCGAVRFTATFTDVEWVQPQDLKPDIFAATYEPVEEPG